MPKYFLMSVGHGENRRHFLWLFVILFPITMPSAPAQKNIQDASLQNKLAVEQRPTVAMLYFDYSGQDEKLKVLRKGLAQMLIADLANIDKVRIVERDRLEALLNEMKLNRTDKFDPQTASRIGKLLGARYLVLGNYVDFLGVLRINANLVEVETGVHAAGTSVSGKPEEFLAMEQKLSTELANAVVTHLSRLPVAHSLGIPASPPRPRVKPLTKLALPTAVQYAKALDAIDHGDRAAAKMELQSVVKQYPDFALAASDLDRLMQ